MKTLSKLALALAFLLLVLSSKRAAAYYDPGLQRWLNRDPFEERASRNLYLYVKNSPILENDPFGLWSTGDQALPGDNTIVCDGIGGIRIRRGHNAPNTPQCILSCIDQHELSHAEDALKANPNICQHKADGTQVLYDPKTEQKPSERKASQREIDCLQAALKCPTKDCPGVDLNV